MLGVVAKILIGALLGVLFLVAMLFAYASDVFSEESRPPQDTRSTDPAKRISLIDEART